MEAARYNLKVQKWITVLSIVLFLAKIVAFYITNSVSILSDALESIVNVIAGAIGLFSLYVAAKPRDEDHPYGHGKAEFISAAIEGTLIIAAGILIIYETVRTLIDQNSILQLDLGLILVAATAIINYVAGVFCIRIGIKNNSLALQASGRHLVTDTYSTLAIIAGLVIILFTQLWWLDKVIAVGMALFIIYNGYKIVRLSMAGIMDEQDMIVLQRLVDTLNKHRRVNWIDLHNLRIIKYGSRLHIDCHLTVPWYLDVNEAHKEIDALTNFTSSEFGDSIEFFVHSDGCQPFSCRLCTKFNCPVRQHAFVHRVDWSLENLLQNEKHRLEKDS